MWSDAARASSMQVRGLGQGGSVTGGSGAVGPAGNVSGGANAIQARLAQAGAGSRGQWNGGRGVRRSGGKGRSTPPVPPPASLTDQNAADALAGGHAKSGLVGIHSASAISRGVTNMRLAFRNSDS